ncbi:hypothetical protein [uncultured Chitinophaga sp.]|uniref:hypothetical protein n=1 Tax=uncultured Chitinophaga sp. TaxID=339340 RepID=UPI00261F6CA2|nr:hypothetical protein [uncultured Chitinophaga sp.]
MKKHWIHKVLAIILLGVFALHTTPREFLHLFAPHQDTVDPHSCTSSDGLAFSVKHQHCEFLQIAIEPYEQANVYHAPVARSVRWIYAQPYIPEVVKISHADASLRAPPSLFI